MSRKERDVTDMLSTIYQNRDKVVDMLSAYIDTADTHLLISLKQSVGVLVEMKTELIKMRQMVALVVEQGCIVVPVELLVLI